MSLSLSDSTAHITSVVRRDPARLKSHTSFLHLLKFSKAVPALVRLLNAGGVWTLDGDQAWTNLVKCKVEHVCMIVPWPHIYSLLTSLSFRQLNMFLSYVHVKLRL
jgi:hypothetical protein